MKRALTIGVICAAAALLVIQFVRPDFSNPPVIPEEKLEASVQVPTEVAEMMKRSCSDCHTNETVYPWYSQISPVSWWLKDHVDHGRSHLNFSTWGTYTPQQRSKKLEEICEVLESGEMPLPSYTWGHGDAVLSDPEKRTLCDWATSVKQTIPPP